MSAPKNAEAALQRMKEGNERYRKDAREGKLADQARRAETVDGQSPWAVVLTCADSRVTPELIFDTGIGELFVIRVAGNIANTSSIASIEYAVANLPVKVVMVLGHQACGAVGAAQKEQDLGYNLNHLVGHITPAVLKDGRDAPVDKTVKTNAKMQAQALKARSTIIGKAADKGKIQVVPAFYHLTGKVDVRKAV